MHRVIISSDKTEYVGFSFSFFFPNGIKQEEQPQQQIKLLKPQRRAHRLSVSLHGCVNDGFILSHYSLHTRVLLWTRGRIFIQGRALGAWMSSVSFLRQVNGTVTTIYCLHMWEKQLVSVSERNSLMVMCGLQVVHLQTESEKTWYESYVSMGSCDWYMSLRCCWSHFWLLSQKSLIY